VTENIAKGFRGGYFLTHTVYLEHLGVDHGYGRHADKQMDRTVFSNDAF